jgi:hypothetical protein
MCEFEMSMLRMMKRTRVLPTGDTFRQRDNTLPNLAISKDKQETNHSEKTNKRKKALMHEIGAWDLGSLDIVSSWHGRNKDRTPIKCFDDSHG